MKGAGFAALLLPGCTLVTEPWAYSELSLETELEHLKPGCGECLRTQCAAAFDRCDADASCVNYAACRSDEPSPMNIWTCVEPPASGSKFFDLADCKGCEEACDFGAQFRCVGRYSWPRSDSHVRWTQRLIDNETVGGRRPLTGLTVRACRAPGFDCGPALSDAPDPELERDLLAWAETDSTGSAVLDLTVKEGTPGFDGIFVVSGPDIPTYRIHNTYPLRSGGSETALLTYESLERVTATLGISVFDLEGPHALFQVQDCLNMPARGVSLAPITGSSQLTVYTEGTLGEPVNLVATTSEGSGAGALLGIDAPQGLFSLAFLRDTKLVNKFAFGVSDDAISVIQAGPGDSSVVEPW